MHLPRLLLAAFLASAVSATAQQTEQDFSSKVFAAGSLRALMADVNVAYRGLSGRYVAYEFGPSGVLRERLEKGEKADVFASANMEHPQALADAGKAGPVRMFARNQMCALATPKSKVTTANVLDRMLDPKLKLATSTPKSDPAGDYAWKVFERAEKAKAGSFEKLSQKALQLVGGPASPPPPPDRTAYGLLMVKGSADIFLTYCTNAKLAKTEEPALEVVTLPEDLAVATEYGIVVMNGATPSSERFVRYLLSPDGQKLITKHGFALPR